MRALQTTARQLSPPATTSFIGVINGDSSGCALGGTPSPSTSPTRLEVPQRAHRPLAVACECALPVPAGPHPSQLTQNTDASSFCRCGLFQWSFRGLAPTLSSALHYVCSPCFAAHFFPRSVTHTIRGSLESAFCAACAGRPINLSSVVCVCVGLMEAGREEERWTEAMCVNDRSAWKIFLLD